MAGPRWVKLDVDYFGNPKILAVGLDGRALHLASILWVARHETDGHIPDAAVRIIGREAGLDPRWVARRVPQVVAAGLWIPTDGGFELHDYLVHNPSREALQIARKRATERQRRWRETRDDW